MTLADYGLTAVGTVAIIYGLHSIYDLIKQPNQPYEGAKYWKLALLIAILFIYKTNGGF